MSAGVSRYASSGAQHQLALLLFFFFPPFDNTLARSLVRCIYLSAGVNLVRPQAKSSMEEARSRDIAVCVGRVS